MSSFTGQTQIKLDDGQVERIITDDDANRPYIVEVVGENDIRIDHRERYAEDGTTLSAGQTHTVSTLRGKALFAAAYDGPSAIRVRLASADVQSQPEKNVEVVNADSLELAASVGIQNQDGVTIDPATNDGIGSELATTHPREISAWSAGTVPVNVDGTPAVTVDNPGELSTPNGSGVSTFSMSVDNSQSLPATSVPDGFELAVKADVNNEAEVLINGDFPLSPGEGVSLAVSNANTVTVASATGTQQLHGIVEVQ